MNISGFDYFPLDMIVAVIFSFFLFFLGNLDLQRKMFSKRFEVLNFFEELMLLENLD